MIVYAEISFITYVGNAEESIKVVFMATEKQMQITKILLQGAILFDM